MVELVKNRRRQGSPMTNQAASWPTLSLALERDPEGVTCISLVMQDGRNVRMEKVPASLLGLGGRLGGVENRRASLEQTCLQSRRLNGRSAYLGNQVSGGRARAERGSKWVLDPACLPLSHGAVSCVLSVFSRSFETPGPDCRR